MQDFTARFAGLAMLTLAAVPLCAGMASVANAAPAAIRVADLDLKSAAGVAAFDARAEVAARAVCRDARVQPHLRSSACEAAVKAEAHDKLAAIQQAQVAKARDYAAR